MRIRDLGGTALVLSADVSVESAIEGAVEAAEQAFGGLDTIIGVAGIELFKQGDDRVDRLSLEVWDRIVAANLTGMFLTCKHGVRALLRNGGGSVTITGSPTAIKGNALGEHAYSASKAGCHGLVRIMATEYAPENIRVNCVIPGFIDTALNAPVMSDPIALAEAEAEIPMRRVGRPDEVAPMMVWLASDEAAYATGAFFAIDGGSTAR